jgi:hypothetical protein
MRQSKLKSLKDVQIKGQQFEQKFTKENDEKRTMREQIVELEKMMRVT